MKNKGLIAIIVLLVIALGVVAGLYLNEKKDDGNINFLNNLNGKAMGTYGIRMTLDYEGTKILPNVENAEMEFSNFYVEYNYTGENIGKLFINEREIDINGRIIQDMRIGTNYDWVYAESLEIGENYNFSSTLYILFEDGTIGKISTDDLKSGNYNISIMNEYKNIKHFIELQPIGSGADITLWAIDKEGNAYGIDMVVAGT